MEITQSQSSYESMPGEFIDRYYRNQKYRTLEDASLKFLLLSLCEELSWIFPKHTYRFSRTHLSRLPHCFWFCSPFILSHLSLIVFGLDGIFWEYASHLGCANLLMQVKLHVSYYFFFVWRMYYLKYTATFMLSKTWL